MSYTRLQTIHDPTTGGKPPATYGDQIDLNFEAIYNNVERCIFNQTLGSSAASISSGTLPVVANGDLLRIRYRLQNTSTSAADVQCRFNGDSGANYVRQFVAGNDTSSLIDAAAATTAFLFGTCGNESLSRWSIGELIIPAYLSSAAHKSGLAQTFDPRNLTAPLLAHFGMHWANTAAITSVSLTAAVGGLATGSSLTIYATPVSP